MVLAGAVAAFAIADAGAYAEFGYYTGAEANPGESGCVGAVAQGVNPTGGCTPGIFPLPFSTAFVHGFKGPGNYSSGTADLAKASLVVAAIYPGGASNSPLGEANLYDTLTVAGALPTPQDVIVTLHVGSDISAPPDTPAYHLDLTFKTGVPDTVPETSTFWSRDPSCAFYAPGSCAVGTGSDVRSFSHVATVDNAHRKLWVDSLLSVSSPNHDLINGYAWVELTLPVGLSVTSASGVFGTAPPVPEPSAALLLTAGLGMFLCSRSRRCDKTMPRVILRQDRTVC